MTGRRTGRTLLVLVVLAAGCTDDPSDDATPPPRPEPAVEAWSLDLPLIGPPVLVGDGVAVVHTVEDEDLQLVAVDTATGERLWSQTVSPGADPPATAVRPRVIPQGDGDPVLVYSRRDEAEDERSVSVVRPDLRTGEDLWATGPLDVASGPEPCGDGTDGAVCVTTTFARNGDRSRFVIDGETGGTQAALPPAEDVRRTLDGGELTDLRVDREEHVALLDDGEVVWRAPRRDVIGPVFTADAGDGWWAHDVDAGVFVGALGRFERAERPTDLTTFRMVALDDGTGAVVWSDEGSSPACVDRIAVPGPLLEPATPAGPSLRCRTTGTAQFPDDVEDDVAFTDLDVVLEHFDPATGETDWELDLGDRPSLPLHNRGVDLRGVGAVAGPRTSVMPVDGTPTLVDLVDGTTSEPTDDAVLACLTPAATFAHPDPWVTGTGDVIVTERYADHLVVPCGPDLEPVDAGLPPDVVAAVGVAAGDVTLVALDGCLVGYETS